MKNKRIIAVAMATGMAVSLAACGGSASTTDTTGTADAATTEAADAATGEGTGFTVQLGPNPETLDPAEIPAILESRDRSRAGPTLPAKGLFLKCVEYDL